MEYNARNTESPKISGTRSKPFQPYHVAAISQIFLPGGSIPRTTADVTGLNEAIAIQNPNPAMQAVVKGNLDTVFANLGIFLATADNKQEFDNVRNLFQALMGKMSNLWDGADSTSSPVVVAKIASLPQV